MKTDRIFTGLTAAILSGLLAVGAVGSLVTGFDLPLEDPAMLYCLCAAGAMVFSFLFSLKWGTPMVLCLGALAAGWLWHRGIFLRQLKALLVRISLFYHNAYHWGYFLFDAEALPADLPLAVLGGLIALAAARAMVRGKNAVLPLALAALPLAACMVVTDTVPEPGFLFLWFLAFLLILLPHTVRRENASQGNRLTALIVLPVLLALWGLFQAVPQEGYVNRSQELQAKLLALVEELPQKASQQMQQLTPGLADDSDPNLNLKTLGPRPRYTHAVMEITADTEGTFYLRGQDYDAYTGTGWTASPHRAEYFGTEGALPHSLRVSTRADREILYLPYYPGRDTILAGGSLKNTQNQKEYTHSYTQLPENWQEMLELEAAQQEARLEFTDLEILQFGSTADRLRYTTLPGETLIKAKAILDTILPQDADRFEAADIIADYVRSSATYDLNTGRMAPESEDFALWFLEHSDTGYCVHFATAAVVLLRAADIPARYVTGYLTRTQPGQSVTVTAGDAHAWAEYYVPQLETWVVLEATPAEEVSQEVTVPGPAPETVPTLPVATEAPIPTPSAPTLPTEAMPSAPDPERSGGIGWILVLLTAILIWGQRKLRLLWRARKLASGNANRQALQLWQESLRLAKLLGQTPPEALQALAQKAKFSQHILTRDELGQFDAYLADCRRQLQQRSWYWQLAYRWVFVVY